MKRIVLVSKSDGRIRLCLAGWIVLFFYGITLSGCAAFNAYHNKDSIKGSGSTSVDAKQRFLLYKEDEENGLIYCAEPSPDAVSAFSAAIDGEIKNPTDVGLVMKSVFSESTATIGLRTQSIQLLRDAMYRNCEGYLAGALEKDDYLLLQKSYQKSMVTLVAIEQLTRAVAPGQVVINSEASRTNASNIVELKKLIDASASRVETYESELEKTGKAISDAEGKLVDQVKDASNGGKKPADLAAAKKICETDTSQEACKEYTKLIKEKDALDKSLKKEKTVLANLEEAFDKADFAADLNTSSVAAVTYNVKGAQQSEEISEKVANTVDSLVAMVFLDEMVQSCRNEVAKTDEEIAEVTQLKEKVKTASSIKDIPPGAKGFFPDEKSQKGFDFNGNKQNAVGSLDSKLNALNSRKVMAENHCGTLINAYAAKLQK